MEFVCVKQLLMFLVLQSNNIISKKLFCYQSCLAFRKCLKTCHSRECLPRGKAGGNPGASRINQTIIKLVPNCTGKCGNDS